jgi:hypothetical protein
MTTTAQGSQPSETDKLAATLAELERERARRVEAGKWSRDPLPILIAVPQAGETLQAAQQRALYGYLAERPDAPKTCSAYEWMEVEVIDPPPAIELPGMQYAPEHSDAIDVTPPWRPPMPPPSPPPAMKTRYSNAGIPPPIYERALKQLANFESDAYDPADATLSER